MRVVVAHGTGADGGREEIGHPDHDLHRLRKPELARDLRKDRPEDARRRKQVGQLPAVDALPTARAVGRR